MNKGTQVNIKICWVFFAVVILFCVCMCVWVGLYCCCCCCYCFRVGRMVGWLVELMKVIVIQCIYMKSTP